MNNFTNALGLDVGEAKIGVARINYIAQISEPLVVLPNDESFMQQLNALITEYSIDLVVVGMPRNMKGEKTAQSAYVEQFISNLDVNVPIVAQDETLSTVAANERLRTKDKGLEDAYAAAVILEDYLLSSGVSGKIS